MFIQRALGPGPESPGTAGRTRGTSDLNSTHLGEFVDTTGLRPQARVTQDSWSTTRAIGPERHWPGRAGRTCVPLDPISTHLGELLDTRAFGPRPDSRGTFGRHRGPSHPGPSARNICSTSWALKPGPESPGTTGGPCWPSGIGLIPLGQPVDTTGPRSRPWSPGTAGRHRGLQTQTPLALESVSTPQVLGAGPESPGIFGLHCGALGTGPIRPGNLLEPVGHQT